jgi:hypothetical protein
MYDLALLKLFLTEDHYRKYRNHVDKAYFSEPVLPLLNVLDKWRQEHDGDITVDDLGNLLFAQKPLEYQANDLLLNNLKQIPSTDTAHEAVKALVTAQRLKDMALLAFEASRGNKSLEEVLEAAKALEEGVGNEVEDLESEYITEDLNELLDMAYVGGGLRWRLDILNRAMGPLRKGDFGFVFARPDTGKTTFLSSEATFMAENLKEDQGPILWFNNEEQASKVRLKMFQSALGVHIHDLHTRRNELNDRYRQILGGKLILLDNSSMDARYIEKHCKKANPSLIIIDQIDKIAGFKNDRPDLQLGEIYIWARGVAKEFCPVIGVTQADGTGEGKRYLTMSNVANAKTAKQAEADWILGIGKDADKDLNGLRFFNVSKNKLLGDEHTEPRLRNLHCEIKFSPEIGRYEDM